MSAWARSRQGAAGEDGAAAVEFALVSLLLVTVLLGIVAFGLGLFKQQSALHAAREGARLAAVGVDNCTAFRTEVSQRGQGADIDPATGVHLTIVEESGNSQLGPGDEVTVTVDYQIDLNYLGFLGFSVINGHQSGKARVERVGSQTSC